MESVTDDLPTIYGIISTEVPTAEPDRELRNFVCKFAIQGY